MQAWDGCSFILFFKIAALCLIPGVLKVYIQWSKSEFSSVSKVRTGTIGYYKTCFCIPNKHNFFEKIKCPLHSKYINNKCKHGKTINLSVSNRGRPKRVFLWPMKIFRNQGSLWPIYDADFFGRYVWPIFFFPPLSHKREFEKMIIAGHKMVIVVVVVVVA